MAANQLQAVAPLASAEHPLRPKSGRGDDKTGIASRTCLHDALAQAVSGTRRAVETEDMLSRAFLAAANNSSRKVWLTFVE